MSENNLCTSFFLIKLKPFWKPLIIFIAMTTIHKNYVKINSSVVKVDSCKKGVLKLKYFESYDEWGIGSWKLWFVSNICHLNYEELIIWCHSNCIIIEIKKEFQILPQTKFEVTLSSAWFQCCAKGYDFMKFVECEIRWFQYLRYWLVNTCFVGT